jgi:O-antigen/teichoic acid export membrane protein
MLAKKIALNTIISAVVRIIGMVVALIIIGLLTRYFKKTRLGRIYNYGHLWGNFFGAG